MSGWCDRQANPRYCFVCFDFLAHYSQLPAEVQRQTVVAVLTTSMHAADTARVAEFPNVEYLAKPLTEEKLRRLLTKRFKLGE